MFFIFNSLIIDNALLALLLSLKSIKQQFLIFINQIFIIPSIKCNSFSKFLILISLGIFKIISFVFY